MSRFRGFQLAFLLQVGAGGCAGPATSEECVLSPEQATELRGLQKQNVALWKKARPASVERAQEKHQPDDESLAAELMTQGRVLAAVVDEALGRKPEPPAQPQPGLTYAVPTGDRPAEGPRSAWVTVVIFSDFQCPFCSRVVPTLKQLREHYGDELRLVFRHYPLGFHARARPAALAAECAREAGKFWPMHDLLFEKQRNLADVDLKAYAKDLALPAADFSECLATEEHAQRIEEDQAQARRFGVRGTPAFFVNGRYISGAQPYSRFEKLVDEALAAAKGSGVAASEYYDSVILQEGKNSL